MVETSEKLQLLTFSFRPPISLPRREEAKPSLKELALLHKWKLSAAVIQHGPQIPTNNAHLVRR